MKPPEVVVAEGSVERGHGRADIREVARLAGVSISTVSRYLNHKVVSPAADGRIEAAIRELGYLPNRIARSLKMKRTMTLGMVIPDITNPYFPEVVNGVDSAARAAGFTLVLANAGEDPKIEWEHLQTFRGMRCDGVVVIPAPACEDEEERIRRFGSYPLPLVFVDRAVTVPRDRVVSDNQRAAAEAVHHLIKLGHTRIALLDTNVDVSSHRERADGYHQVMREAGLELDPALVIRVQPSVQEGFAATTKLLEVDPRPTAIFVPSNRSTIGALQALAAKGFDCPGDIALVSYDDYEWQDSFRPRLTTVAQPAFTLGERGAEILIARITGNGAAPFENVVLPSRLIVRESSGTTRLAPH
ncbi:MAG TPA: LacI family DNA-binding transcriptional regulator [Polyangia bacterium]